MILVHPAVRPLAVLALATSAADSSLLPLLPEIRRDLDLSGTQTGALFTATTVAVLITALPVGRLAGRIGVRPLLLTAAALVPLSLLGMAFARSLEGLLAARIAFGLSFTVMWAIGPALAASRRPGASGTAAVIAASGVGWLVGPIVSGVLADVWSWRVPLAVIGVLSLPAVLPFLRPGAHEDVTRPVKLRETVGLVASSPAAAWAAVICALLGVVTGATGVLVPTVLAYNGVSSAGIGLALAVSSGVWIVSATCSARIRGGRIDVRLVGGAVAVLAACWALPVASLSSVAVVGFLVLTGACRAILNALLYPLGTRSTEDEPAAAALVGLMNLAWAAPALVTPLLVGAAGEQGATRAAFAVVCALAALVAAGMIATGRRPAAA